VARESGGVTTRRRQPKPPVEIGIVISGPANSGRSTIASIISEALREAGATVTVVDDDEVPAARFGPLTGKSIRIDVRRIHKSGAAPLLRIVK